MSIRSWQLLLRSKERRIDQQKTRLVQAQEALDHARADLERARQEHAAVASMHEQVRGRMMGMMQAGACFRTEVMLARRHQVEQSEARVRQAASEEGAATRQVDAAHEDVLQAKTRLQRLEHQREQFQEKIAEVRAALERAAEDVQDEEAEETAVARILAAARAGAGDRRAAGRRG